MNRYSIAILLITSMITIGTASAADSDRKAEFLARWDVNKDGQIDDQERAAARAAFDEKRAQLLSQYDADGDGRLSREERAAAREAGAFKGRKGEHSPGR